jgi:hypothetical protein
MGRVCVCVRTRVCLCVCVFVCHYTLPNMTFVLNTYDKLCGWVGGRMCACVRVCVYEWYKMVRGQQVYDPHSSREHAWRAAWAMGRTRAHHRSIKGSGPALAAPMRHHWGFAHGHAPMRHAHSAP